VTSSSNYARSSLAGTYLTFFLADEEYGVEIVRVQEIISAMPVTRVPRTPSYVRGVINLRGKVIAVMDLREKLGIPHATTPEPVMIVLLVAGVQMAVLADRVAEVASIRENDIQPSPHFGARADSVFLLGLSHTHGRLQLLLDIDRMFSSSDVSVVAARPTVPPVA
jgi:purine-binding chemotaxis protein CheW